MQAFLLTRCLLVAATTLLSGLYDLVSQHLRRLTGEFKLGNSKQKQQAAAIANSVASQWHFCPTKCLFAWNVRLLPCHSRAEAPNPRRAAVLWQCSAAAPRQRSSSVMFVQL